MSESWIVGGALRDELLGREVTDIDIAVEGNPGGRGTRAGGRAARAGVPALGGLRRLARGRRRGGRVYDFARLQGETIEEDLAKRDFTVNAMAQAEGRAAS